MSKSSHLPEHFPTSTKYVLEADGPLVRRYVEFPNGRRMLLSTRKAISYTCEYRRDVSIVPVDNADAEVKWTGRTKLKSEAAVSSLRRHG
jgi:hypothetical protein